MEYSMEELLPIVTRLTEQYTSKESSSVTYETAHTLMEAVIYCIRECLEDKRAYLLEGQLPEAKKCYTKGYEIVIQTVYRAKEEYEKIIENFLDYGCKNYHDTILKGMPEFFLRYDPKFQPQNQLLTLDYPLLNGNPEKCGVDLILEYLQSIRLEQQFLFYFEAQCIQEILERIFPDYETMYFDNICYEVLFMTIGCSIARADIRKLQVTEEECRQIEVYFQKDDIPTIQAKIEQIIEYMIGATEMKEKLTYFQKPSYDYAVRIWYGIQNQSLKSVFHVDNRIE